jgi:hypothetical protein
MCLGRGAQSVIADGFAGVTEAQFVVPKYGIKQPLSSPSRDIDRDIRCPAIGSIRWSDIEALLLALGAEVTECAGSRVGVYLFGEVRVFHRPHPSPDTDKGAVASPRKWLNSHGVRP